MDIERALNPKILEIAMRIHGKHPELVKFIVEMPLSVPIVIRPEINVEVLPDYYGSLGSLLKK